MKHIILALFVCVSIHAQSPALFDYHTNAPAGLKLKTAASAGDKSISVTGLSPSGTVPAGWQFAVEDVPGAVPYKATVYTISQDATVSAAGEGVLKISPSVAVAKPAGSDVSRWIWGKLNLGPGLKLSVDASTGEATLGVDPPASDGTISVARLGSLAAAQAALPGGKGTITGDKSVTISAPFMLKDGQFLACQPGITITMTDPAQDVIVAGKTSGAGVFGCTLIGGHSSILAFGSPDFTARWNKLRGYSYRAIDVQSGSTNVRIEDNDASSATCTDGIFGQDTGLNARVLRNTVDASKCTDHGIAWHTYDPGGSIDNALIEGNTVSCSVNFCLEIGQFHSGGRVSAPMARGNRMKMVAQGNGGISIAGADYATAGGNDIDLGGFSPKIAGIEFPDNGFPFAPDNTVRNGGLNAVGLSIDSTADTRVSGGRYPYISINNSGTFPGVTRLARNTLENLTITIPPGSNSPYAIKVQCNVAGCDGGHNIYRNLTISGIGIPNSAAINEEVDFGSITGTIWSGNNVSGFTAERSPAPPPAAPAPTPAPTPAASPSSASASGFAVQSDGKPIGNASTLNIASGTGVLCTTQISQTGVLTLQCNAQ